MEKYDAVIIGFGKAGKTLAAELAQRGKSVAMIEQSDKMYGGTCINVACIPTKSLIYQAKTAVSRKPGNFEQWSLEYEQAIVNKDKLTSFLRKQNFDSLNSKDKITIYTGTASFVSAHEIKISMGNETLTIKGDNIFINTGAETIIPDIKGIQENKYVYTSASMMDLDKLPEHLIIIGGGYIGLEFASMYATFDVKVTVLESHSRLLPKEDPDVADCVKSVLEKKNIEFILNTRVLSVKNEREKVVVSYEDTDSKTIYNRQAEGLLLATGRKPNIEKLNLSAAGVKITDRGTIAVDEKLRTNVPHIWAMGDVKGGPQFTYISLDDYRIIREQLFGNGKRNTNDRDMPLYSVFIDPPLSQVGMTEGEALKKGYKIKVAKITPDMIGRARILGETDGLMKAVVDEENGKILGCTLFCAESSEIINIVSVAIKTGQKWTFLRDNIFTHPSMSEGLNMLFSAISL
ncbi:MAG: FAD-dependent oxidoreductase [Bacteroidales bacterium]|nr:FAD-dependent oxidoreductase [Bacteroidales bacterium]